MRIFIPYSINRDIFKGEELKFAIRSIEKYLTGWEDIILIGHPPDWFNGKVIEAGEVGERKEERIYRKMLLVEDNLFLRWDDDHFLLKPLDIFDFRFWYDGYLKDYKNGSSWYHEAINNTLQYFPNAKNFDIHTPIPINREKFHSAFNGMKGDVCIKSYYLAHGWMPGAGELMTDLKIKTHMEVEEIKKLIEGRLFFSTGTLFDPMREVLNELYPQKSRYEL